MPVHFPDWGQIHALPQAANATHTGGQDVHVDLVVRAQPPPAPAAYSPLDVSRLVQPSGVSGTSTAIPGLSSKLAPGH